MLVFCICLFFDSFFAGKAEDLNLASIRFHVPRKGEAQPPWSLGAAPLPPDIPTYFFTYFFTYKFLSVTEERGTYIQIQTGRCLPTVTLNQIKRERRTSLTKEPQSFTPSISRAFF